MSLRGFKKMKRKFIFNKLFMLNSIKVTGGSVKIQNGTQFGEEFLGIDFFLNKKCSRDLGKLSHQSRFRVFGCSQLNPSRPK